MKNIILFITVLSGWLLLPAAAPAQVKPDTAQAAAAPPGRKELPEIQLQEYTIIGLAKVTLPKKSRTRIFKDVEIRWVKNREIFKKELPSIAFDFSRVKPSIFRLYEFPWLEAGVHYGSFNSAGVQVNTQFRIKNTLPYFSTEFGRSDGHTENAGYTQAGLQAGLHQQLKPGHLLHLSTAYRFRKQGIWRDYHLFREDWEAQQALWEMSGVLEQQWTGRFSSRVNGNFYRDEQKNAFQYTENGFDLAAAADVRLGSSGLEGSAAYQSADLSAADGNLVQLPPASGGLREYKASLFNGRLVFQQQYRMVTARLGILYQQSEEETTRSTTVSGDRQRTTPQASLSIGFGGWGNLSFGYHPGLEFRRLREIVRENPFSDVHAIRTTNYTSRWQTALLLDLRGGFQLNLGGTVAEAENYETPLAPADSLAAVFTKSGYPGWMYGVLPRVLFREMRIRLEWQAVKRLRLSGWLTLRNSEIKDSPARNSTGNELPYFPRFSGRAQAAWNFLNRHQLKLWAVYSGTRYDDLQNTTELDSYVLLNAEVVLRAGENFSFYLRGRNLLDTGYAEYFGFNGPGIHGDAGIRLRL